jgi:phosphoglycerol transferase MdoB-like AlkP superfamily enzyme
VLTLLLPPLRVMLFSLLVFTLIRAGYHLAYPEYFGDLGVSDLLRAYLVGLRFDASIAAYGCILFLLPALLPIQAAWRPTLVRISLWLTFAALMLLWGVNIGDFMYFGEVYRHAGREVLLLAQDYPLLLDVALKSRLGLTLTGLLAFAVAGVLWHYLVVRPSVRVTPRGHWATGTATTLLAVFLLFLAGRGVIRGMPLSTIDAFSAGGEKPAALALNGAFATLQNARKALKQEREPLRFFSPSQLEERLSQYDWQRQDPMLRSWAAPGQSPIPRNVVLILLESWSYRHIDGLTGGNVGATPFVDSLLARSRVWENFHAAGQRSIEGVQAVLTSVPVLPSQPPIGWGLEQNRMTRLAHLLKRYGYESFMFQTSNRRSYYMESIAEQLGFQAFFGKEDIPLVRQYPGETPMTGWDYDGLMFMADYLEHKRNPDQPFFAFFFSGTTHEPYADPGEEFHIRPHGSSALDSYLNTLRYSDWALGEFMQRAARQDWYRDTVFIFLSDHTIHNQPGDPASLFRVPFFIYTPDGSVSPGRETGFASQYDVLPTLMTLLGIDRPVASFGRSLLLDDTQAEGVVAQRGSVISWLSPNGTLSFSASDDRPRPATGIYTDPERRQQRELHLKTLLQWVDQRLNSNAWLLAED